MNLPRPKITDACVPRTRGGSCHAKCKPYKNARTRMHASGCFHHVFVNAIGDIVTPSIPHQRPSLQQKNAVIESDTAIRRKPAHANRRGCRPSVRYTAACPHNLCQQPLGFDRVPTRHQSNPFHCQQPPSGLERDFNVNPSFPERLANVTHSNTTQAAS